MKALVKSVLAKAGVRVLKEKTYKTLISRDDKRWSDTAFLQAMPRDHLVRLFDLLPQSKAQLRQDLFVLSALNFKRNGFFVEFGATDGLELSNTALLEEAFGWRGILAEPARCWHDRLRHNRPRCAIETDCVWSTTGERLEFIESGYGVLSTVGSLANVESYHQRKAESRYEVRTISLNDMLAKHGAPSEMDYLSIDTEGSELEILSSLDHERFKFRIITCEHNWTQFRQPLYDLLTGRGYKRACEQIDCVDDWYVLEDDG